MRLTTSLQIGTGVALVAAAVGFAGLTPGFAEALHPAPNRLLLAGWVVTGYVVTTLLLLRRPAKPPRSDATLATDSVVCYASQTGSAEAIARQTAVALGWPCLPLHALSVNVLARTPEILFVLSTTGDGDAPDDAREMVAQQFGESPDLRRLRYAVLALGDRRYTRFCAFGHLVDQWLAAQGAQAMHPLIEMDNSDPAALAHWQALLRRLGADANRVTLDEGALWTIESVQPLNPASPGHLVCLVRLSAPGRLPDWSAGDVVDLRPRHGPDAITEWQTSSGIETPEQPTTPETLAQTLPPQPWRTYSIASIPSDGVVELVVRQMFHPDGRLGPGSAWLTRDARAGDFTTLRLRANPRFHLPPDGSPLILIGNGTGIAGLRALLKARIQRQQHNNWLMYGERCPDTDRWFGPELEHWRTTGQLARLDLCFSRAGEHSAYVQHRIHQAAQDVQHWVQAGATIMVCGSQRGMATGVDEALQQVLGREQLQTLAETGRYRRDVY